MSGLELVKKLREETGAGILACQKALKDTNNDYESAIDLLRKQGAAKAMSKADRVASDGLCGVCSANDGISVVKLNCETDFVAKNAKFQQLLSIIANTALNAECNDVNALLTKTNNGKTIQELITEGIAAIGENIVLSDVKTYKLQSEQKVVYYVHNQVEGNNNLGRIVSLTISQGDDSDEGALLLKQINMHIAAMSPIALTEKDIPDDILNRERAIYQEQVQQLNKPSEIAAKMVEGKMRKFYEENVLLKQIFVLDNKNSVANVISDFNKKHNTSLELLTFCRFAI